TPHLAGELFQRMAGIKMTHVPYRGAAPVLNDLMPGRVDVYFASGALLTNMRAGQIRGLAVTGARREPAAPELAALAEPGVPGDAAAAGPARFGPRAPPAPIVTKINADAVAALAEPAVQEKLALNGYHSIGSSPQELSRLLKAEIDKWGSVVKDAGIQID